MDVSRPNLAAASDGAERRVVIVEDDDAVRSSLSFSLAVEGFVALTFASAEALLKTPLHGERVCFVIDHFLPGMSGLDLLAALRENKITNPAILITSHPSYVVRDRAQRLGASILEKPLLADAVPSLVRELIAGSGEGI